MTIAVVKTRAGSGRSSGFGTGFTVWLTLTTVIQGLSALISHVVAFPTWTKWLGVALEGAILWASISAARWARLHPEESLGGVLVARMHRDKQFGSSDRTPNRGVSALWSIWAGLLGSVVCIGAGLGALADGRGGMAPNRHLPHLSAASAAAGVLLAGVACVVVAMMIHLPLKASSDETLRASYLSRFFIWTGLYEVPLFLGVVAFVLTNRFWLYLIGSDSHSWVWPRLRQLRVHSTETSRCSTRADSPDRCAMRSSRCRDRRGKVEGTARTRRSVTPRQLEPYVGFARRGRRGSRRYRPRRIQKETYVTGSGS